MKIETPSLQASDDASAAVQKTPNRVTLESMKDKIVSREYIYPETIPHMTICVLVTSNGFSLIGKTAPADPDNFDVELGKRFAFEDALRQMWPLEAYLLRQRITEEENAMAVAAEIESREAWKRANIPSPGCGGA